MHNIVAIKKILNIMKPCYAQSVRISNLLIFAVD